MRHRLVAIVGCLLAAACAGLAASACVPAAGSPMPLPLPLRAPARPQPGHDVPRSLTPGSQRRGIHLPAKALSQADYDALRVLQPGSVVLLSAQLGDPDPSRQVDEDQRLEQWLAARPGLLQIVRLWPVRGPDDPKRVAARIIRLHQRFPWIHWFQIANEPDIEWANTSWRAIGEWTTDVWWNVEWYRRYKGQSDIKLLFPPFSQWSGLNPEVVGYDQARDAVELYLDHGDGLAGHEYWDKDRMYLVEDTWPAWLRARLSTATFFVTECGRRPLPENGLPDYALGEELIAFSRRTRASVVAPFVLSSPGGVFDQHDFVDRQGRPRPPLFAWGLWGP